MSKINDLDFEFSNLPKPYLGYLDYLDTKRFISGLKDIEDYGFDFSEIWNLDTTLVKFLLPRLKRFKDLTFCYPSNLKNSETWKRILEKMIIGFSLYTSENSFCLDKKKNNQINIAFKLLSLYIHHLWY